MSYYYHLIDTEESSPSWDDLLPHLIEAKSDFDSASSKKATHFCVHESIEVPDEAADELGLTLAESAIPYPSYIWVGRQTKQKVVVTNGGDEPEKEPDSKELDNDDDFESSVIEFYSRPSKTSIVIGFLNGDTYLLNDVPAKVLDKFEAAESKGTAWNNLLKGKFEGEVL